jgi:PAS domain-containing protein
VIGSAANIAKAPETTSGLLWPGAGHPRAVADLRHATMSRSACQEHYDELTREINALMGELADADARKRLASVQRRIDILYRTLRDDRLLLETVLENSAASINAKRRDGLYTYLNREMELLCNVTREQVLGRTDFEVFPSEIAQQWRGNDLSAMATGRG